METRANHPYAIFMLVLSLLSLVGLAASTLTGLGPEQRSILLAADSFVCLLFFADFLGSLYRAPDRLQYFLRWGWLDLLSSVPTIDALRLTRVARIARILRVIRGIKATKILVQYLLERRAESAFMAVTLISLLMIVAASIAVLQFETQAGANIRTAQDALWWAICTLTTVGYGDVYPVTEEGRIVAALLMICGVGLVASFAGFVASWFLKPGQEAHESEIAELVAEVRDLKRLLAK
jgi:voltage-gated potassium channel